MSVRSFQPGDLDSLMQIWLDGNLDAHPFIPADFWHAQLHHVRALLPRSQLFLFDEQGVPVGFLGLDDSYIAGVFVGRGRRSCGIGKALLNAAKSSRPALQLHVYAQNQRALAFYQREGFTIRRQLPDPLTGAPELLLEWHRTSLAAAP